MTEWTTSLELSSNDPCRTTLVLNAQPETPKVVYTVSTDENGSQPVTTYKDASGRVFATLEWRTYLPDRLQVGDDEMRVVGKWLRKSGKGKQPYVL